MLQIHHTNTNQRRTLVSIFFCQNLEHCEYNQFIVLISLVVQFRVLNFQDFEMKDSLFNKGQIFEVWNKTQPPNSHQNFFRKYDDSVTGLQPLTSS